MNTQPIAGEQLRSIVERVERLHEERKTIADDISEVFKEAKGNGFDVAILKSVIKRRADPDKTAEADAMIDLYESQLGTNGATHVHMHEVAA